ATAKANGVAVISASGMGANGEVELRALQPVSSFLSYRSDLGDYVGQGLTRTYQLAPGSWQYYAEPADGGGVWRVWMAMAGSDWSWELNLAAPSQQALRERNYPGAARFPFQDVGQPGLDFSGNGRGCNKLAGGFTVDELVLKNDSTIGLLHARFTQHCEGASAALHGEVRLFGL